MEEFEPLSVPTFSGRSGIIMFDLVFLFLQIPVFCFL